MFSQKIKEFLDFYNNKEKAKYEKASSLCADFCEQILKQQGIRALVTKRAKDGNSLRNKIKIKEKERGSYYNDNQQITDEISDLAGVRIALYFPEDCHDVEKIINDYFVVEKTKHFPKEKEEKNGDYNKVFSGYRATHFIVKQKTENLSEDFKDIANYKIEIQVASVLMHAWAEVEHDLIYKPNNGVISVEERQILDEVNGLVLAGNIALGRLQSAISSRLKENGAFSDEYNLRTFLNKYILNNNSVIKKYNIGRSDILFEFIKITKLDDPSKIEGYLRNVNFEDEIAEQIIVQILNQFPNLEGKYKEAIDNIKPYNKELNKEYYKNFTEIVTGWTELQKVITQNANEVDKQLYPYRKSISQIKDRYKDLVDSGLVDRLEEIRKMRNSLVHNMNEIDMKRMSEASQELQSITSKIKEKFLYLP